MKQPVTKFVLEAPGGLVHVTAECGDGKARRITVRNVASGKHEIPGFAPRFGSIHYRFGGFAISVWQAVRKPFGASELQSEW